MKKNIVEIFFDAADTFGDNTAIIHKNTSISYNELRIKVESISAFLVKKGLKKGDKVLVFIPMSVQLYATVLALFSIGAVVVFVDEWANKERLKKAISVVDIDTIIAPRKLIWLAYILPGFRKIQRKFSIPSKLESMSFQYIFAHKNDTALITFTTGSTGNPKAANRTHQFLWEQFRILKDEIGANQEDRCLITLPIVLLSILGTGATGYIADFNQKKPHKLQPSKQATEAMKNHISLLIASPFYIEKLAEVGTNSVPSLRKILTGGAPVFPSTANKIIEAFPRCQNVIAYGSTEAEPISTITMKELTTRFSSMAQGLCVGQVHKEVHMKIIRITDEAIKLTDKSWSEWECKDGELGEIIVTGPHVLDKYYNSEIAFRENKINDQGVIWHRTGDSGKLINDYLFLHGRCKQLIMYEGQYISPFIVEYQLQEIAGVTIGTLIKDNNQLIICVESRKGMEQGVKDEILKLEIPHDNIAYVNKIPRDPRHFSKIDYGKLVDIIKLEKT